MAYLELLRDIIGHLAWPTAVIIIFFNFKGEISGFIGRIKNAKYKGVELNLEKQLEELKTDAEMAGVTILYPTQSFFDSNIDNIEHAPEWAFLKSWQEIENVIVGHYSKISGMKNSRVPFSKALSYIRTNGLIDSEMEMLINKLRHIRNLIVHSSGFSITRGEALEWLGISKSIKDRIEQKLGI